MAKKKAAKRAKKPARPAGAPTELLTQLNEINRGLSSLVQAADVDGIEKELETISGQLENVIEALRNIAETLKQTGSNTTIDA